MRRIGVLGGMSAASTRVYYDLMCDMVQTRRGGLHSPDLLIRSLDFAPIAKAQAAGDWDGLGRMLRREAETLVAGGAEILILATNTMHKLWAPMTEGLDADCIHIADATAAAVRAAGHSRAGLMATAFTMEQDFYTGRLAAGGVETIVPAPEDRAETHRIIYEELCRFDCRPESETAYTGIAERLATRGASCLILGCTEVGLLLNAGNAPLPIFDTTRIHCAAAIAAAMGDQT